jgi:hypothetical protein
LGDDRIDPLARAAAAQALEAGAKFQILPHPHVRVQRIVLRHVANTAPHLVSLRKNIQPRHRGAPELAGMKQDRMRMVVLLPAPLGPSRPTISPRSTLEGDIRHRGVSGVALGQFGNVNHHSL